MVQSPCLLLLLAFFITAESLHKHKKWEKLGTSDKANANDLVRHRRTTYLIGPGDGDLKTRISEANSRLSVIESTLFRIENILNFLKSGAGISVPQSAGTINVPHPGGTYNVPYPGSIITEPLVNHPSHNGGVPRFTTMNVGMDYYNHHMNLIPMHMRENRPNIGMQPHHQFPGKLQQHQFPGIVQPQHQFQAPSSRGDLMPLTADKTSTPKKVSWMNNICSEPCGVPNIPRNVRNIRTNIRPVRDTQTGAGVGTAIVGIATPNPTSAGSTSTGADVTDAPGTVPPSAPQKPGPAPAYDGHMRVVGGTETIKHKYPWQVYIQVYLAVGGTARCGGSIINDRYVLTAGHCTYKGDRACTVKVQPEDVTVTVAEHNINSINDDIHGVTDRIDVRRIIRHPKYCTTRVEMDHDIALLRLAEVLVLSDIPEIGYVCLPGSPLDNFSGMTATIAGWGYKEEDYDERDHTDLAYRLQEVNIKVHPDCSSYPNQEDITPNMICAGDEENVKDACGGDSGGPLVVERNGQYTLAGLVSFGPEGGDCTGEGVYVKVTNYLQWIKENTMDAGC